MILAIPLRVGKTIHCFVHSFSPYVCLFSANHIRRILYSRNAKSSSSLTGKTSGLPPNNYLNKDFPFGESLFEVEVTPEELLGLSFNFLLGKTRNSDFILKPDYSVRELGTNR